MNRAFIFPGQGSQFVGMGKDFFDAYQEAREVFEEVDEVLSYALSDIIFNGPEDTLTLTKHTQCAIAATSIAILRVIQGKKHISDLCSYVCGHSLGEYSALCAAGSISLKDTAFLLKIRGSSMQEAVPEGIGAMAACIGINLFELEETINKFRGNYLCQIANDNIDGQIVISGHAPCVDLIINEIKNKGYKAVKLKVSAPFHCDLMKPAQMPMTQALNSVKISKPGVPLIANVSVKKELEPSNIKQNLIDQICGKVRWRETLDKLKELGVKEVVEIGPGKVLTNMIKKADYPFTVKNVGTLDELDKF